LFVSDNSQIPKHPFVNEIFLQLLKNAKSEIVTETPYFILKHQGYDLLMKFLEERGRFVMLTNGLYSTDVGLVAAAFMERITEPLKKGAEVFVYGGSHPNYPMITTPAEKSVWGIHSKTVVFDQKHTLIGTFNLDPRSVNFNHELAFVCMNNPALAAFVTSDIQSHMAFAGQLGLDGKPKDNRYPYFEASPVVKAGLWVFSPLIQYFDEFL
jgi:phosphatidylserine/phosphatidylglycerophosphate/cardiolipin synthase-like enzyme